MSDPRYGGRVMSDRPDTGDDHTSVEQLSAQVKLLARRLVEVELELLQLRSARRVDTTEPTAAKAGQGAALEPQEPTLSPGPGDTARAPVVQVEVSPEDSGPHEPGGATGEAGPDAAAANAGDSEDAVTRSLWWQLGPLRDVGPESAPVVVMALAGGVALLLGMLYLVWYSVQQGWIDPRLRLVIGGALGVGAMGLSWRFANTWHRSLAASVGGAGLGGWFGTLLVARHVYEYISSTTAFAGLAIGAAAGLLIASSRNLRALAWLATAAAYLTPIVTSTGEDRLHELMIYQLVVLVFLYVLEERKRWPELGHAGLWCTWGLLVGWADEHLGSGNRGTMAAWGIAVVLVAYSQSWQLLRLGSLNPRHAVVRVWVNAWIAWLVIGSHGTETEMGQVCLILMVINAAGLAVFHRIEGGRGAALACLSVGWTQLFAAAPMWTEHATMAGWWLLMCVAATAIHARTQAWRPLLLWVLPYVGVLSWATSESHREGAWQLGLLAATLALGVGLWPRTSKHDEAHEGRAAMMTLWGAFSLHVVAGAHFERTWPGGGLVAWVCLGGVALAVLRSAVWATKGRLRAAQIWSGWLTLQIFGWGAQAGLLNPVRPGSGLWSHSAALLGLAALAVVTEHFCRARGTGEGNEWVERARDAAGLLRAAALLIAATFVITEFARRLTESSEHARSLAHAGWSVAMAVAGLSLMLRGLRQHRTVWRRTGLALLAATALKLALFDLVRVSMALRVLSFMGLGVCLLLGAYWYRRLSDTMREP